MSIDTVNDLTPRVQYVASAAQTDFDYPFPIFAEADLVVDVDGVTKTLTTHYTVSGEGDDTGGTVTFLVAMSGNEVVTIYRDMALERTSDFPVNGAFSSSSFNDEFDRITLVHQDLAQQVRRCLRMSMTAEATDSETELSPISNWLEKYVYINASGVPEPATAVTAGTTLSQSTIGAALYPRTAEELAAGITPTDYFYPYGNVLRYGADSAGVSDSAAAIQAAIDLEGDVLIPPGTYLIASALDLKGKTVAIRGVPLLTVIRATTVGMTMIDVEETADLLYSPFVLYGLKLDGDDKAAYGIKNRYRHHSVIEDVYVIDCTTTGLWEKDTWLSRRRNFRTDGCVTGLHLVGSNHSSHFDSCSFNGADTCGVNIGASGTALDGNYAINFTGCDVEFGAGKGIVLAAGTTVNWNGGYLGENIEGVVIENNGGRLTVDGGFNLFGYTAASKLVSPIAAAGEVIFTGGARVGGQDYGTFSNMVGLSSGQIPTSGTFRLDDVTLNVAFGGDQAIVGNALGFGEKRTVLANRLGRTWTNSLSDVTTTVTTPSNGIRVVCATVTGASPLLYVSTPLINTADLRLDELLYLVVVYKASQACTVRMDSSALGASITTLGTLPASTDYATYVKLDQTLSSVPSGVLSIFLSSAIVGDYIEVHDVYLTTADMHGNTSGTGTRLFKC
jgi:hypothetical protein